MKILLVYPMWTDSYTGVSKYFAKKSGGTYPPLNLALLGAIAEKQGHQVEIIDAEIRKIPMDELATMVHARGADVIGLTGMSPFFHLSRDFAAALKKKGEKAAICMGGQHITIMEEEAYEEVFDYGFIGDGEESWSKFLSVIAENGPLDTVPGLMYRSNGSVIKTEKASSDKDLDVYPRPAYHLLDMEKYILGTLRGRLNFTTLETVRGCPWKCIFCASDELETTRITKRSIKSVVDQMENVVNSYGVRHYMVIDDVLTLHRSRTVELCNEIIDRKLNITFEGSTRANLLDDELVALMKKAGLTRLSFGLETVDEDMRKTMNKKVPLDAYREANALLNKYDVEALNSVMIGLPGESEENVRKTLDFLRKAKDVKQANFAIAVPYPGTEFHRMAVQEENGMKLMSKDFSEYRRYGSAVTSVSGLTPDDLIRLQNEGFVSVYSRYWRWWPVVKKNGILGLLITFYRLINMVAARMTARLVIFNRHPSLE
jgi:anaerobic magnesium-protoporphyrin IX monomethyl ester cyclase